MKVAAVVPHWNRRDLLRALLSNLSQQSRPFDEIIVVDNGSSDDSAKLAADSGARVVRLEKNFGFARAVNEGICQTRADWIAILNNDVLLDREWLTSLVGNVNEASFATGKILSSANPRQIDAAFDEISRGACAYRCGAGRPDSPFWNEPREIRFAPMTAAIFRRDLFERVGPLDESFGSYLEDIDFGLRCALAGFGGKYVPSAIAHHHGSATSGPWNKATVRLIARNQVLLAAKHFRGQPRWPLLAGQLLWGCVALKHGGGIAYLRGKREGFRAAAQVHSGPERAAEVGRILEQSESQILEIQQQTGFDWYWRVYFWLSMR